MAYFQQNAPREKEYTRQFPAGESEFAEDWEDEEEYDDGFDELLEDEASEIALSEEELRAEKRRKYRIAAGFGDLGATVVGVGVILALVAFLITMIRFVTADFTQNLSLWQPRF